MTSSDSTPDFSWLNKNEEEQQKTQSEESQTEQVDDQSESTESSDEAGDTEPPVNPTAETWIQDAPDLPKPLVAQTPIAPETPVPPQFDIGVGQDEGFDSESVLDDDPEDEVVADPETNDPTIIMPGRQLSEADNEKLNSSNRPEDLTVVLPPETPDSDADPVQNETFAEPEAPATEKEPQEEAAEQFIINTDLPPGESVSTSDEEPNDEEAVSSALEGQSVEDEPSIKEQEKEAEPAAPGTATANSGDEQMSNTRLILLASYASAMTLIALFLLMRGGSGPANNNLESLPDVAPEPVGELTYVPVNATLPAGHVIKIGEKQRFGNIEVEPLRVVREPLEFTHYSGDSKAKRPATDPVVKIWLKFTNVSEDQEIAPLDGNLLLRWVTNSEQQREFSNQYLFGEGASQPEDEISTYRHSKTSDWDLSGQNLGKVLKPGESYETYIASTESLPVELPQQLNWRIQFRKGYSPKGWGVTTLIDVSFETDEIKAPNQAESASETTPTSKPAENDSYFL